MSGLVPEHFCVAGGSGMAVLAYSYDGITWNSAASPLNTNSYTGSVYGVAWNGSLWVAVGNNGDSSVTMATSSDGITWTSQSNPFDGGLAQGIAWNGSVWLASGYNSDRSATIITSSDGITWNSQSTPFDGGAGGGAAWNGSLWVAVGNNADSSATIATSSDGTNWTSRTSPFSGTGGFSNGIAWNGSLWIAVGYGPVGTIATSSDGIIWSNAGNPFPGGAALGIAWNGSLWVAVGGGSNNTTIATSSDGIEWTSRTSPFDGGLARGIAWNGVWVAVGYNAFGTESIATSPDGITWTARNDIFDNGFTVASRRTLYPPVQGEHFCVAGGAGTNQLAYSYDGITWTGATNPLDAIVYGVGWNGSLWVAVGNNGDSSVTIATSPDGIRWTQASNNPFSGGNGSGVAWNGSLWVASGYNGGTVSLATSSDGITWTDANPFEGGGGAGIAWNGSLWVAVGGGSNNTTIATSSDGLTWTAITSPLNGAYGIAWNGSLWVAVGATSDNSLSIITSPDGSTWTSATNPLTQAYGIAWNGSLWVAVGNNGDSSVSIVTSPDGITWTPRANPLGGSGRGIAWNGSVWVALANGSESIATSPDGITWTSRTNMFATGQAVASRRPLYPPIAQVIAPQLLVHLKAIDYTVPTVPTPDFTVTRPDISGCQLWLDGSDAATIDTSVSVTAWNDKSGQGNNATGVGGLTYVDNKVVFDGSSGYFSLPNGTLPFNDTSYTYFIVVNPTTINITNFVDISIINGGSVDGQSQTITSLYINQYGNHACRQDWNYSAVGSANTLNVGQQNLVEMQYDSGGLRRFFMNLAETSDTPGVSRTQGNSNNTIGASNGGNGDYFSGTISEILVYDTSLSNTDRQAVEAYLIDKWGIQVQNKWLDATSNHRDATLENGTIAKNTAGNGLVLDGSTNWIFPDVGLGNAWTASVWYKNTGDQNGEGSILTQINNGGAFPLSLGNNNNYPTNTGEVNMGAFDGQWHYGTTIQLETGQWTNIQVTWDGTNMRTYVGGVLIGSVVLPVNLPSNGQPFRIGRRFDGPSYMVGEIGEVRIYNAPLTQAQVTADYNESLATFPNAPAPQLLVHLKAIDYTVPTVPTPDFTVTRPDISGCQLWLDGSDAVTIDTSGSVTAWNDKSGQGNNATGVGGLTYVDNALVFDGTGYFTTPYTANPTAETVFIVMNLYSTVSGYIMGGSTTMGGRTFAVGDGHVSVDTRGVGGVGGTKQIATNTTILYDYTLNTNTNMYYNGSADANSASPSFYGGGNTWIGYGADLSVFLNGSISEVLIYDTVLSTTDRQAVEAYLIAKWGIQVQNKWLDATSNHRDATLENGTIAKNTAGNGLVLDGSTNWIFPDVGLGNAWTAAVWYKKTAASVGSFPAILTQRYISGDIISLNIGERSYGETYQAGFLFGGNWYNGSSITLTNAWTNIQVTWDGTNLLTYINGTVFDTAQPGGTSQDNGEYYRIGRCDNDSVPSFVTGEIGEVRIYNAPLTQAQVTADYNESLATFATLPPAIANLTTNTITGTSFAASWTGGVDATSYSYSLNLNDATPSYDKALTEQKVTFTNLTPSTSYTLRVTATNGAGSVTEQTSLTTLAAPAPVTPEGVTALKNSFDNVTTPQAATSSIESAVAQNTAPTTIVAAVLVNATPLMFTALTTNPNFIGSSVSIPSASATAIYSAFAQPVDTNLPLTVNFPAADGSVTPPTSGANSKLAIDLTRDTYVPFSATTGYGIKVLLGVQYFVTPTNPSGTLVNVGDTISFMPNGGSQLTFKVADLDIVLTPYTPPSVICFLGSAPVLTPTGYRRIDRIQVGDIVITPTGTATVEAIKKGLYEPGPSTNPYIIPEGKFGANRRLLISPRHKVLVDGKMVEARNLGLEQEVQPKAFVYYNIQITKSQNMIVAGVEVESLARLTNIKISNHLFNMILATQYGGKLTDEIKAKCRFLGDGVSIPVRR